jgi:hypothetical protein
MPNTAINLFQLRPSDIDGGPIILVEVFMVDENIKKHYIDASPDEEIIQMTEIMHLNPISNLKAVS